MRHKARGVKTTVLMCASLLMGSAVHAPIALAQDAAQRATPELGPGTAQRTTPELGPECPAVHIVVTPGAGTGDIPPSDAAGGDIYSLRSSNNIAADAMKLSSQVTAWQNRYPGSLGGLGSFMSSHDHTGYGYGQAVELGVNSGAEHIRQMLARCANTKFVLLGYSQGAQVTGDIAALHLIPPERVMAVYLIADPKRGALAGGADAQTTTIQGQAALRTEDGAVQVILDQPEIDPHSSGLAGARADGVFAPIGNKVHHFCVGADVGCAAPEQSLSRIAANWVNDEAYRVEPPESFIPLREFDGVLLAQLIAPQAPRIVDALSRGNADAVQAAFAAINQQPFSAGSSELSSYSVSDATAVHRASLAYVGADIASLMRYLRDHQPEVAGAAVRLDPALDPVSQVSALLQRPGEYLPVLAEMGALMNTQGAHGSYVGRSRPFSTVDGVRVDDWIAADMQKLIAAELDLPLDVHARHVSTRHGLKQEIGFKVWGVVKRVHGDNSEESYATIRQFDL